MMNKIKYLPVLILLLLGITASATVASNDQYAQKDNFAVLLRQTNHFHVAVRTARDLRANPKFDAGRFEIIVCGEEIKSLQKSGKLAEAAQKALKDGIEVTVCGISMEKFQVKKEELVPGVKVVANGLMRAFELEKEGHLMVEL